MRSKIEQDMLLGHAFALQNLGYCLTHFLVTHHDSTRLAGLKFQTILQHVQNLLICLDSISGWPDLQHMPSTLPKEQAAVSHLCIGLDKKLYKLKLMF